MCIVALTRWSTAITLTARVSIASLSRRVTRPVLSTSPFARNRETACDRGLAMSDARAVL
jgi:hypothetical protein